MCESKRSMSQPLPRSSPPQSQSPSPSQCHPLTPEKYARYSPNVVRRMQTETCFKCDKIGHWSWDCPLKSANRKPTSPSPGQNSITPICCRCGHGYCEVKTSKSLRNYERKYFACPIKRGKKCSGFVKWCDEADKSDEQPPAFKYPECECGAGVCRREMATPSEGPDKYYFACPVAKNHGSCGYLVWEDDLLNGKSVPIQRSRRRTLHELLGGFQHTKTDNDLGMGVDLLARPSKRIRFMDSSESPSSTAASEVAEQEDGAPNAAPSKCASFPESEAADDLDPDSSQGAIGEKALHLSCQSTSSTIFYQQIVFQRHNFTGHCTMGWLGRLVFFNPTQSLKFPPPQRFFCCIFPSLDPIHVPKQAITGVVPCGESNQLATSNLSQCVQVSTDWQNEISKDVQDNPDKSPGSGRKPISKTERQVALFAQKQLLIELETIDPHEHGLMIDAAESTLAVLKKLGVDYQQFYEHVMDFVNIASTMAEMDKSIHKFLPTEEYKKRLEEEKVRFADIQNECFKKEALLEVSNQHRQSLLEEISHLKAMLHEKKSQLKCCELEILDVRTELGETKRRMLEAETTLNVTAKDAEVAKKLSEERQAKQIAAKTAMEKARLESEI